MIDGLSDNSLGKGRLPLSLLVERDMERFEDQTGDIKDSNLVWLSEKEKKEAAPEEVESHEGQLKGVLFILDSMRKTKSSQRN